MEATEQKRLQADVPADLARRVRVLAANCDISVPAVVKAALEQYLERKDNQK